MKVNFFLKIAFFLCLSLYAHAKQSLVFAVNPYKNTEELRTQHAELIGYLEKALQREIVFIVSKDYTHLLTLIEQGNVDIASISPKLFATSRQKKIPTHYLATFKIQDHQGNARSSYRSLIITRQKNSLQTLNDVKGKRFGFTDVDSTSGYLYPRFMLKQEGIDPQKELGKVYFLKKHPKIMQALLENSIDAGAIYDGIYLTLPKSEKEEIRILASSDEIPYDVMIASKGVDKALVTKIRELLLAFHSTQSAPNTIMGFEEKSLILYDTLLYLE
ncbi:phosphate/phosphite/phosphonate ABC transporter substrate-binding protein [Sulfurospirillum barnesii]|uniref:Phosphate/phosphite/phosphonate ABC transporters, periplasmic binding protein n=1 Tax=Sulfurospirillum barnesii (strain ATCC 700032 / DSM 10660 / SES-3) TaxID=760154 RepID=I3XY44_SULBS|nr:phosphate/phosphite/phosphonate ABC transporter substrate-binding protein [Sulfurospirillum barnesii]AFL68868.1 phosphate/phosphite/phosphonate ABC transporters, periplasmic binding protein [Sulfurospirillum barnesii SES-3]